MSSVVVMDGCKRCSREPRLTVDLNRPRYQQLVADKGWKTQTEQALALGISQNTISRIERGHRPGPSAIAALLTAFDGETFNSLFKIVEDVPVPRAA